MKNKYFVLPVLTFIIGGGIGVVCGVKGFTAYFEHYLQTDECQKYVKKKIDNMFDELIVNQKTDES